MQTTLPFGQGIYPDQFQSYYNAGYQLQQEDAATNPFVPNMPQQMAPVQTGYYTDPDGSMDHQYGEVVDQHGLFTVDYSVQGGVEQYYTDPMTSMDYYQYSPIPTIDNYGYYNSFNEMYNSQQSKLLCSFLIHICTLFFLNDNVEILFITRLLYNGRL